MRIDLVALDLDGTLLAPDDSISPRNRELIERVLETGVRLVLVTGRGVDMPIRISNELDLNMPFICCHGALVKDFHANRVLVHTPVPQAAVKLIVDVAQAFEIPAALYIEESFCHLATTPQPVVEMLGNSSRAVESFSEFVDGDGQVTFLRLFGERAQDVARTRLADMPVEFLHFDPWYDHAEVAIVNRDANKRAALARFCADFQIPRERVLAIGDSRNDVPMLRWAGVGIAMGNASDEVKTAVSYVTASNRDDGVALALERFVPLARKRSA